MDEETPKPTIDPESPSTQRPNDIVKTVIKQNKKDYHKVYHTLKKFRALQIDLLNDSDIEDPDPFQPTYIFFCFTGIPRV